MNRLKEIKAVLFDLDGVLYIDNNLIDGAVDTVNYIRNKGYKILFITNTTTKSFESINKKLEELNITFDRNEIFSAHIAAIDFLRKLDDPRCYFVLNDDIKNDFSEFNVDEKSPEYIVIGDIGNKWNYDLMNKLFLYILNGAKLIALHKGKYWLTENGYKIDIGAFIAGLEYATGKQALVLGKPSPDFFRSAISKLDLHEYQVAMVGDDLETDIGAAQNLELLGVLVRTGKYQEDVLMNSHIHPDLVIDSIKDLPKYL